MFYNFGIQFTDYFDAWDILIMFCYWKFNYICFKIRNIIAYDEITCLVRKLCITLSLTKLWIHSTRLYMIHIRPLIPSSANCAIYYLCTLVSAAFVLCGCSIFFVRYTVWDIVTTFCIHLILLWLSNVYDIIILS